MKPVCVKCGLEMNISEIGVNVIEMFQDPPQPYKAWSGDQFSCPNCEALIVDRFPDRSFLNHFDSDFLDRISDWFVHNPENILICWEKQSHLERWGADPLDYLGNWIVKEQDPYK